MEGLAAGSLTKKIGLGPHTAVKSPLVSPHREVRIDVGRVELGLVTGGFYWQMEAKEPSRVFRASARDIPAVDWRQVDPLSTGRA